MLRWIKSPAERAALRHSAHAATRAIRSCIAATTADNTTSEADLAALFRFKCDLAGAERLAYPSVVASGADACTVHYGRNDKRLRRGDLLLMDAGCEVGGYASDVSRTWPVSGRFSPAQRVVYAHVLEVHQACIAACVAGATLRDIHSLSVRMLSTALQDLGVGRDANMVTGGYMPFYPHSVGHWLGLDTHDASSVAHDIPLEPGVVLTIEPGLYLAAGPHVPPEFADIGIRIEDDVLIGADGRAEVLSAEAPTDIAAIEELAGSAAGCWAALRAA